MADDCADTVYTIQGNCCSDLGVAAPPPASGGVIPPAPVEIPPQFATVLLPIDNGTDFIVAGMFATAIITFPYKIIGYRLISDDGQNGNIELKIEYATNTAFPIWTEISGAFRPTLVAAQEQENQAVVWGAHGAAYSQIRATAVADSDVLTRIVLGVALEKL